MLNNKYLSISIQIQHSKHMKHILLREGLKYVYMKCGTSFLKKNESYCMWMQEPTYAESLLFSHTDKKVDSNCTEGITYSREFKAMALCHSKNIAVFFQI